MQIFEVLAIGLPFCAFKIIAGLYFLPDLPGVGGGLLLLGLADLVINLVNLGALVVQGRRLWDACLLSFLTRRLRGHSQRAWAWRNLGLSIDVLLAMALVAYMIGTNAFPEFPRVQLIVWNTSVILNVLGAGFMRLGESWHDIETPRHGERRGT